GELYDEHDVPEVAVTRMEDRLVIGAELRPDELFDITGLEIPDTGGYETIAGFVVNEVGRVPQVGDKVEMDSGELIVTDMDGAAVTTVEYVPDDPKGDTALMTLEERIRHIRLMEESNDG